FFFFSSRRRHTRSKRDWSSDVCSSDLASGAAGEDGQRVGDESGAEDDAHLREPGHRSLSGDLLGEQSADGVTGGDAGSGEQLGGDEFGLFADVSGHRCLVFMWFRGGRSPACAARWAETGDPWPVVVGV